MMLHRPLEGRPRGVTVTHKADERDINAAANLLQLQVALFDAQERGHLARARVKRHQRVLRNGIMNRHAP